MGIRIEIPKLGGSEVSKSIIAGTALLYGVCKLQSFVRDCIAQGKTSERRKTRLVVITGCDSGLGLSMAKWALDSGYNVLAGCLSETGEGPELLVSSNNNHGSSRGGCAFVQQLDVRKRESMEAFASRCEALLTEFNLELYALITNAAVAVPGEFFWLTEEQARSQMDVNFWGVVNLTDIFQNMLLSNKSRLIVITSDCADFPFPGLAMYSATKGAVENWAVALRLEVAKFGMTVVAFQPGSFVLQSRIMCCHEKNFDLMKEKITQNGLNETHDRFLDLFYNHWSKFNRNPPAGTPIVDSGIKRGFFKVLEKDVSRTPVVKTESWSHSIFHFLIQRLPRSMSDFVIYKAVNPKDYK